MINNSHSATMFNNGILSNYALCADVFNTTVQQNIFTRGFLNLLRITQNTILIFLPTLNFLLSHLSFNKKYYSFNHLIKSTKLFILVKISMVYHSRRMVPFSLFNNFVLFSTYGFHDFFFFLFQHNATLGSHQQNT